MSTSFFTDRRFSVDGLEIVDDPVTGGAGGYLFRSNGWSIGDGVVLTVAHGVFEWNRDRINPRILALTPDGNGAAENISILLDEFDYGTSDSSAYIEAVKQYITAEFSANAIYDPNNPAYKINTQIEGRFDFVAKDRVLIQAGGQSVHSQDAGLATFLNPQDLINIANLPIELFGGSSVSRWGFDVDSGAFQNLNKHGVGSIEFDNTAEFGESGSPYILAVPNLNKGFIVAVQSSNYGGRDDNGDPITFGNALVNYFEDSSFQTINSELEKLQVLAGVYGNVTGLEPTNLVVGAATGGPIVGTYRADVLVGRDGDDQIYDGDEFEDTLWADDTLIGGDGQDTFFAGAGDDIIFGGNYEQWTDSTIDTVDYRSGADPITINYSEVRGAAEISVEDGQGGTDTLHSIEKIIATGDHDILRISSLITTNNLTIDLGGGQNPDRNDSIIDAQDAGVGVQINIGTGGVDWVSNGNANGRINLIGFNTIIFATDFDDDIFDAADHEKVLDGGEGSDKLSVGSSTKSAILFGGEGSDEIYGGSGDDFIVDQNFDVSEAKTLSGSTDPLNPTWFAGETAYGAIDAGAGDDTIVVSVSKDSPWLQGPDYYLDPGEGNDVVDIANGFGSFGYSYTIGDGHDVIRSNSEPVWGYSSDYNVLPDHGGYASVFSIDLSGYSISDYSIDFQITSSQLIWEDLPNQDGRPVFGVAGDLVISLVDGGSITVEGALAYLADGGYQGGPFDEVQFGGPYSARSWGGPGSTLTIATVDITTSPDPDPNPNPDPDPADPEDPPAEPDPDPADPQDPPDPVTTNGEPVYMGTGTHEYIGGGAADRFVVTWDLDSLSSSLDGNTITITDRWGLIASTTLTDFEEIYDAAEGKTYTVAEFHDELLSRANNPDIFGTDEDDELDGTNARDRIYGYADDDILNGLSGDDFLDGGLGADTLAGGTGDDTYVIDDIGDVILENADEGIDLVRTTVDLTLAAHTERLELLDGAIDGTGNELANRITGNDAGNTLAGLDGDDNLIGNAGDDILLGGSGNDQLISGDGDDTLDGGDGNDTLIGGIGADSMTGGDGDDAYFVDDIHDTVLELASGGTDVVYSNIDGYVAPDFVERLVLGDDVVEAYANDTGTRIDANDLDNILIGGAGNDVLHAGEGVNVVEGGAGDDTITAGSGDDEIFGGTGNDVIRTGTGYNYVEGGDGDDIIHGGDAPTDWEAFEFETDELIGGTGNDTIYGYAGDDYLGGGDGDDLLFGGAGWDYFFGGAGNDVIVGDGVASLADIGSFVSTQGSDDDIDGQDSVFYDASREDLDITALDNGWFRIESSPGTGAEVDYLVNVEYLAFDSYDPNTGEYLSTEFISLLREDAEFSIVSPLFYVPDDAVVEYTLTTGEALPDWMSVVDGKIVGTPPENFFGQVSLLVSITSPTWFEEQPLTLEFFSVNDAPVVQGELEDVAFDTEQAFSFDISAITFSDVDGDNLAISATLADGSPLPSWLGFDGTNFSGTAPGDPGELAVVVRASDGTLEATSQFVLSVTQSLNEITGTAGDDSLYGTDGSDSITGLDGDDYISARDGDDVLVGGDGDDNLVGGAGADAMIGGAGNDLYLVDDPGDSVYEAADEGTDRVRSTLSYVLGENLERLVLLGSEAIDGTGNALANRINGNDNVNVLIGLAGNDYIAGGDGDDFLDGGDGDDRLLGDAGADTMIGGAGDDTYYIDEVGDSVYEAANEGSDTVRSAISYVLGDNLEWLILIDIATIDGTGNALANELYGNAGANVLTGLGGDDKIVGGDGDDFLHGGDGDDTLTGGSGADVMIGGAGNDIYNVDDAGDSVHESSDEGNDKVNSSVSFVLGDNVERLELTDSAAIDGTGNALANEIEGNASDNVLTGLDGDDLLKGKDGDDVLDGGEGNDTLAGGAGADMMIGGAGDDVYYVNDAGDSVHEAVDEGFDLVRSSISFSLSHNVERLVLTDSAAIDGLGNALANQLYGNSAANVLDGLGGNDLLKGHDGDDTLGGGEGDDRLVGGAGDDVLEGGEDDDVLVGDDGTDVGRFSGEMSSYSIVTSGGALNVTDNDAVADGNDGTDTISGIEQLEFKNGETVLIASPIILDLTGQGIETVHSANSRASFDMNGDGLADDTSWIGSGNGFLFFDRDGNGTMSGIEEISFIGDVPGAASDLAGLVAFDSNSDGLLDGSDERFAGFGVWQDLNSNGVVDSGETGSLADFSIRSIGLEGTANNGEIGFGDVAVLNTGSFTLTDGSSRQFADAAFTYFSGSSDTRQSLALGPLEEWFGAIRGGASYSFEDRSWLGFNSAIFRGDTSGQQNGALRFSGAASELAGPQHRANMAIADRVAWLETFRETGNGRLERFRDYTGQSLLARSARGSETPFAHHTASAASDAEEARSASTALDHKLALIRQEMSAFGRSEAHELLRPKNEAYGLMDFHA